MTYIYLKISRFEKENYDSQLFYSSFCLLYKRTLRKKKPNKISHNKFNAFRRRGIERKVGGKFFRAGEGG